MSATVTGGIVFACTLAGVLFGMWLRGCLPKEHLDIQSRSSVKDVNGLIATMTALILGLMTASAQNSYENVGAAVEYTAADIVALDRLLARHGPGTAGIRATLRGTLEQRVAQLWPAEQGVAVVPMDVDPMEELEQIGARVARLDSPTEGQQWLRSRALDLTESLLEARWDIFAGRGPAIPPAFLIIITFWLTATFAGYALFAPRNRTISVILVVGAFSVACVIFLILELGDPFEGRIAVSADALRFAIAQLGR